ncbi:MAG: STAS domain-containing protein [Acidimicrobiales bacterium]
MVQAPERMDRIDSAKALQALEIEVHTDGREPPILKLRGEVDIATIAILEGSLSTLADGSGDIVVDLADVDFIGLAGLEVLCGRARCMHQRGDRLVISSPPPIARRVIDILGVGELLSLHDPLAPVG